MLVFLPGLEDLSSATPQAGTGKLFFKMLVHIKWDFPEAPSKLASAFQRGFTDPISEVGLASLRRRGFVQVWGSLGRTLGSPV